jgi:hypothetical protein
MDIEIAKQRAIKKGLKLAVRLNGTSDKPWEDMPFIDYDEISHKSIIHKHGDIQFYDYTKCYKRIFDSNVPDNLHFTFSYSGRNKAKCMAALKHGVNVAVIFGINPPKNFWGYKVINGGESDLRFLDKSPSIVGLRAKGLARRVNSRIIVRRL